MSTNLRCIYLLILKHNWLPRLEIEDGLCVVYCRKKIEDYDKYITLSYILHTKK